MLFCYVFVCVVICWGPYPCSRLTTFELATSLNKLFIIILTNCYSLYLLCSTVILWINPSTCNRFNTSTCNRFNTSTCNRFNTSTCNRFNTSTCNRFNTSTCTFSLKTPLHISSFYIHVVEPVLYFDWRTVSLFFQSFSRKLPSISMYLIWFEKQRY